MGSSYSQVISFQEFCEFATKNGFKPDPPTPTFDIWSPTAQAKYAAFIQANSSPHFNIRDRQEAAMFFAHVLQESGFYQFLAEKNPPADAYGYTKTKRPEDRQQFCGRGYIQLSHDYNYEDASKALFEHKPKIEGIEAENTLAMNPSLVEEKELIAWHTALWYWSDRVKKQCDLGKFRFGETTKIINSMECENPLNAKTPKEKKNIEDLNGKALKRFKYYEKNLEVLGIKAKPIEGGCYN